jgi:hypothetical protein
VFHSLTLPFRKTDREKEEKRIKNRKKRRQKNEKEIDFIGF